MQPSKTYLVEDLFEDIPGDTGNVMFKIPPEIAEEAGWKEGDTMHITAKNGSILIKKIDENHLKISLDKPSK
jgi:hypothetical protein